MARALGCGLGMLAVSGCSQSAPSTPVQVAADEGRASPKPEARPDPAAVEIAPRKPSRFLGRPDAPMRRALATGRVVEVEKGRGGRSLAFKLRLEGGTSGYYKPEQSFSAAHWYSEVASYYLDRELGLFRVPPTVGRRLPWALVRAAAGHDRRIPELVIRDGWLRGAFIWWIPEPLVPLRPGRDWERWIRAQGPVAISPYQRPRGWRRDNARYLAARRGESTGPDRTGSRPPRREPDTPDRSAELSDMILFDYLTSNVDRWGGNFTNVRTRRRGGPLIYLDNGAGFTPGEPRIGLMDSRLHALSRFRRSTVQAIRKLSIDHLVRRMRRDPLAPILNDEQLQGLRIRRRHLLEHVAAMQARFGDRAMPWE